MSRPWRRSPGFRKPITSWPELPRRWETSKEAIHHWEAYLQFDRISLHGRIAHKRIQLLSRELKKR